MAEQQDTGFITDADYKAIIGTQALQVISQATADVRETAETEAIEEISGYLRPKYDVAEIFTATGDERNAQIVMICCDIALYHMSASLPQRMGAEVRQTRYDRAIQWLSDVQRGKIVPDLPQVTDADGNLQPAILRHGSEPRLHHNW